MSAGSWSADVVLEEVGDLRPLLVAGDERRFSLVFRADLAVPARQGTYRLQDRNERSSYELFAVPVDRGRVARYFQAIVNTAV